MMKGWVHTLLYILAVTMAVACESNTIYDKYQNTTLSGWEKNDTLSFALGNVAATGTYNEEIGMRINGDYPFTSITLIVDQTVVPGYKTACDTLKCELTDSKGLINGHGISYYQYSFPLKNVRLAKGDSLRVCIRHAMKREILPGIANVGLKISRRQ